MKKSIQKLGLIVAIAVASTSILAGCSKKNDTASTTDTKSLSNVTLKMYLLGDKPKDYDAVYGQVNKLLQDKIHAKLDVNFISWGDVNTKYPLLFSSGEDFDLAFTATGWCFYNQMATRNGFYELTQADLQKYAPQTWKSEPKVAWDQAKVNGKIYMVPNDQNEYGYSVYGIRGDLAAKYGIGEVKTEADLEKYYDAVAKNEKDIVPIVNGGGQNLQYPYLIDGRGFAIVRGVVSTAPLVDYKIDDTNGKAFAITDTPEYATYAAKMKQFADKGYWSKSSISSKETRDDAFKAGKAASMVWNVGTVAKDVADMNKAHPEWKAQVVDTNAGAKKVVNPYTNNGIGVNASSKNPQRALMALDLLRYDQDIQDLTFFGIKGTHWDAVGTTQYKSLDASSGFPSGNVCPWGWHTSITRSDVNQPAVVKQLNDLWVKQDTVNNPLVAFTFDDSKVKNELAAIGNVVTQYGVPIDLGIESDATSAVATYKQKLKDAGLDKVMTEVQSQIDTYKKSLK